MMDYINCVKIHMIREEMQTEIVIWTVGGMRGYLTGVRVESVSDRVQQARGDVQSKSAAG